MRRTSLFCFLMLALASAAPAQQATPATGASGAAAAGAAAPAAASAPATAAPGRMPRLTWTSPYDPGNILAKQIRGEAPAAKLYEDRHVLAVMDTLQGHFVVFSKTSHARNFMEIDAKENARLFAVVQRIARAQVEVMGIEGFLVRTNAGSDSGVAQYHIHVYPHRKGDPENPPNASPAELQPLVERIRAALR